MGTEQKVVNNSKGDILQVFGMHLKPIFKELNILEQCKLIYEQHEGAMSRLYEIWEIDGEVWKVLDTLDRDEENQLIFKYDAWWITPEAEIKDEFRNQIYLLYGEPNCEFWIGGKHISCFPYKNDRYSYDNLLEYFHCELDEYNSETIVNMCLILCEKNNISLLGLFRNFQKRENL